MRCVAGLLVLLGAACHVSDEGLGEGQAPVAPFEVRRLDTRASGSTVLEVEPAVPDAGVGLRAEAGADSGIREDARTMTDARVVPDTTTIDARVVLTDAQGAAVDSRALLDFTESCLQYVIDSGYASPLSSCATPMDIKINPNVVSSPEEACRYTIDCLAKYDCTVFIQGDECSVCMIAPWVGRSTSWLRDIISPACPDFYHVGA